MSLNIPKKGDGSERLTLAGPVAASAARALALSLGAKPGSESAAFHRFPTGPIKQRSSHPLYQAASGPCSSIPLVTFSSQFFDNSLASLVSGNDPPSAQARQKGTAPIRALRRRNGPRQVGARPMRRRRRKGARGRAASKCPLKGPSRATAAVLYRRPLSDGGPHACRSCDDPLASDCATVRSSPGAPPLPCERACSAPLPAWSPRLPRGRWRPLRIRNSASCLICFWSGHRVLLRPHVGSSSGHANRLSFSSLVLRSSSFATRRPRALRPTVASPLGWNASFRPLNI